MSTWPLNVGLCSGDLDMLQIQGWLRVWPVYACPTSFEPLSTHPALALLLPLQIQLSSDTRALGSRMLRVLKTCCPHGSSWNREYLLFFSQETWIRPSFALTHIFLFLLLFHFCLFFPNIACKRTSESLSVPFFLTCESQPVGWSANVG